MLDQNFRFFFVARFYPCVGCSRIKGVIGLRLFKTAGVFVEANRRTGCKYLVGFMVAFGQLFAEDSIFNLAMSRCCFEDCTYILGAEEWLLCGWDRIRLLTRVLGFVDFLRVFWDFCVNWSASVLIKGKTRIVVKKYFLKKQRLQWCVFSNMGVYEYTYPLPHPFLERGIAELVFRRAAYVPLSRIKPSHSFVLCREYSHSVVVAVLTAVIVVTVAGSVLLFGCSVVSTSESCWVSTFEAFALADDVESSFFEVFSAEGWAIFMRLRVAVAEVMICLNLCSARKHSRDCFGHPQMAASLFWVGNLMPMWYVDGTPWGSHDHVVDSRMINHHELENFCYFLDHDWQLDRSKSPRHFVRKNPWAVSTSELLLRVWCSSDWECRGR